jgi:hypothetical protein
MNESHALLLGFVGPLGGAVISALVSFGVFVVHSRAKEKKQRALELLERLMINDDMVRARLIAQEYLVENGSKYDRSLDPQTRSKLNFQQLDLKLAMSADPADNEARVLIRTITSYFWLINQARDNGQIARKETLFSEMYAWYWTFIIKERIVGCDDNRQFREFAWMSSPQDLDVSTKEHNRMLAAASSARLYLTPPGTVQAALLPVNGGAGGEGSPNVRG